MNNYEKIKAMTIDEMAEYLVIEKYCWNCPTYIYRDTKMCPLYCCKDSNIKEIKQWLESESEK